MHRRSFAVLFAFFLAVTTTSHQWCFAEEALGHNPSVQQRNRRVTPTRIFVSTQGSDQSTGTRRAPFRTIQHALNVAVVPGDKVLVRGGVYRERIQFPASGNRNGGPITLRGYGKERVTLRAPVSASSQEGQDLILIKNRNYIRVMELEIAYNFNVNDGAGIRVTGHGHHVVIRNNHIHQIEGQSALGIAVYGTSTERPLSQITIEKNSIRRCGGAAGTALAVSGNVTHFRIADNVVHHVYGIGISAIGGDTGINPNPAFVARHGLITRNLVYEVAERYGRGFLPGIYVDGARNIRVDSNEIHRCNVGIEIGAQNQGGDSHHILVRNNLIHRNDNAGISLGGYVANAGRVRQCRFLNNTLFRNDRDAYANGRAGQIGIRYAHDNVFANNIVWGNNAGVMLRSEPVAENNRFNHNLWYLLGGEMQAEFIWGGGFVFRARRIPHGVQSSRPGNLHRSIVRICLQQWIRSR